MSKQRICELIAVLPALNEAGSIANVVDKLKAYGDIVVVDDGSTDGTGDLALAAGGFVVSHSVNRGYEQALESGLLWAAAQGYRYAITLDADGQHSASAIALFARELEEGADIVVGVRDRKQRWAETFFSLISKRLWKLDDPLCGMKGYRLDLIRAAGRFDTYSSVGTEFCIRAARSGSRIHQIEVSTSPRIGASRFGGGLRANLKIVRALWLGIIRAKTLDYT
ncbi:glycosyltransferase family 2 protein [Synechococcus sp. EJ6-Ellesmere]|uniref:glycosyltransferase family 2 protein n=1 Tax=Synechococcus sp. EJ6-Ellesmere TaxID=2823734 RepID=UPI0020CF581C|nr:glycosyltransferase family 2 protein [Synechococcus sp. EJ6-Ellesmere]MCP9824881.1 glycosyltransferase family 2 protein [Synechococcus sp. EJ6-Ellesmere]